MSNWDNDLIFEAYKKKNRPLEESISILLKNDLILANHIYNEWSMSDWHSGVKKVAQRAANVGGFLMDKVKKYIVEPILGKNREVLSKLSKVKTKEELAQLLKTYGEDEAFQLINNEAITNAERRVQNNESYLSFWDLILLEASEIDAGLKSAIIEFGNSLGEGGAEMFKDLAETNISLAEVDGNDNLKRLCKFVAKLIEDDSEDLDEVVKLSIVLSNLEEVLQPTDDDYEKKYGTELKKIISNKTFQSNDAKNLVSLIKGNKESQVEKPTEQLAVAGKVKPLKATKAVSKLDEKTRRAASALQRISDVMPTEPKDVQTVINLIANPEKLQGDSKNALKQAISKAGKESVKAVIELAGKISTGMMPPPALNILDLLIQRYGEFIVTLADEFKSDKDVKEQSVNGPEKRAFNEVKAFVLTFGTEKKLNNFFTRIQSKKIKTKNTEQQAYINFLNSEGKEFVESIKIIAAKILSKNKASAEEAPKEAGNQLEIIAPERKFQPKDVINIFKYVNLFFQRFSPQVKNLTLAFNQSPATSEQQTQQKTTVGSLMAERYGIKNVNQAIQILSKSSDPKEIAKAIMFVTFQKHADETVDPERFDSAEIGLAKNMSQWVEDLKKTKSVSKLREHYLKTGYDRNVIEALVKAFVRLADDPNIDNGDIAGNNKSDDYTEIEAMVSRISKGDEELKKDILNALASSEERIQQAKDSEEKQARIEELREFLLSKGFATEENISHVMSALDHMSRGGLVRPHDSSGGDTQQQQQQPQVNNTEGLKQKVKKMGSTSFFKIAYDIIMDRNKMMSLGIGMAILFICFLLFGAPFLALLYVAIKAKQAEGEHAQSQGEEEEDSSEQESNQPSAMSNVKQAVVNKGREVLDKTKKVVQGYMNPKPSTP